MRFVLLLLLVVCLNSEATINSPVAIDSRIKTFIYSPNEIFRLKFVMGYQSIIELEKDESIDVIMIADPLPWKISILNNRIIVKPLDAGMKTNMTIVTNKRTYLMDIASMENSDDEFDDQVTYLVRFFYPEIDVDAPIVNKIKKPDISNKLPQPEKKFTETEIKTKLSSINFQYTFAGSGTKILPIKVFDDGNATYLQFPNNNAIIPSIYGVNSDGTESLLTYRLENEYIAIDTIERRINLRYKDELICLFNEMLLIDDKDNRYGRKASKR